jgi:hypothetical protein
VPMYVDHIEFTGNFVVSSMRVFHALSAGKIEQAPTVGGGPGDTPAAPPPELEPEELAVPELDPEEPPELAPASFPPPPAAPDPDPPPHETRRAVETRAIACRMRP